MTPQPLTTKISPKITCIKFHSNLPGTNELTPCGCNFIPSIECSLLNTISTLPHKTCQPLWWTRLLIDSAELHWSLKKTCCNSTGVLKLVSVRTKMATTLHIVTTYLGEQYGHHFTDGSFECIFLIENYGILINISLRYVSKGPIENKPALVLVPNRQLIKISQGSTWR